MPFLREYPRWCLVFCCALLFLPGLGLVPLFDWDEINFAEISREFIASGNYLSPTINFEPFYEKPPLFMWLQAICMNIFGVGEWAARLPNALVGIISILFIYNFSAKHINQALAGAWSSMYIISILPHFYFKSALIDPLFNLFIFSGICMAYRHLQTKELKHIMVAGILIAAGVLTKGPVALLLFGLTGILYLSLSKQWKALTIPSILLFLLAFLLIVSSWYVVISVIEGPAFVRGFIIRQWALLTTHDAGHTGFPGYHIVVLFFGCLPASLLAFRYIKTKRLPLDTLMACLLLIVVVVFELVQTKILHYSSLAYFPITYFGARGVMKIINHEKVPPLLDIRVLASFLFLVIMALIFIGQDPSRLLGTIQIDDPFAVANLQASVNWPSYLFLIPVIGFSLVILSYLFRSKKGTTVIVLALAFLWFTQSVCYFLLPRVERYTQGAVIDFLKDRDRTDIPVYTLGHKSYAHHFYGNQKPDTNYDHRKSFEQPSYIIMKTHKEKDIVPTVPDLSLLYRQNGFSFFIRQAANNK